MKNETSSLTFLAFRESAREGKGWRTKPVGSQLRNAKFPLSLNSHGRRACNQLYYSLDTHACRLMLDDVTWLRLRLSRAINTVCFHWMHAPSYLGGNSLQLRRRAPSSSLAAFPYHFPLYCSPWRALIFSSGHGVYIYIYMYVCTHSP